jgi:uronate dehydrogenase
MSAAPLVCITGAAGNLGGKLRRHLDGRYPLRLLDRQPGGDPAITAVDLAAPYRTWAHLLVGVRTLFHFAADPTANQTWPNLLGPNVDALVQALLAAREAGVARVVYASSNHVMGAYKDESGPITTDLPPRPGTRYVVDGEPRDSGPYGAAKLFGERLGKALAEAGGPSFLAVRLGWTWPGDNRPQDLPANREPWYFAMWLSNRDFCRLMECCLLADPCLRFAVLHGMSANAGMRWDLESTRRLVGYEPLDDVTGVS